MDRDEAIRRAEIAMAWARGEVVQFRLRDVIGCWITHSQQDEGGGLQPFREDIDIRIKPKPLERWVWVYDGEGASQSPTTYVSTSKPVHIPSSFDGHWVRMREVTNETDD